MKLPDEPKDDYSTLESANFLKFHLFFPTLFHCQNVKNAKCNALMQALTARNAKGV